MLRAAGSRRTLGRASLPVVSAPVRGTTFDDLFSAWTPNTGTAVVAKPAQSKPVKASNLTTPGFTSSFGVPVFRTTAIADQPDTSLYLVNEASRRQVWNCDNSRFVARSEKSYWYLYDAGTFIRLAGGRVVTGTDGNGALGNGTTGAPAGDCELWWHPTDPNRFYYTDNNGGLVIRAFNLTTKASPPVMDLTGRLGAVGMGTATRVTTRAEGRMSDDGRYAAFMVRNVDAMLGVICVDLIDDLIVGSLLTTNLPDHVSMSPLGNYVTVAWSGGTGMDYSVAAAASANTTNGVRAYNRTFSAFTQINTYGEHSDLALDTLGNEVIVTVCYTYRMEPRGIADGDYYYARLDNGTCYQLGNVYGGGGTAVHFNGTGTKVPGWALMTMQAGSGNTVVKWQDECITALQLAPTAAKHLRLTHHHTAYVDEWTAPEATFNSDGTRVMFRSNFGTPGGVIESYMAVLPGNWPDLV